MRLICSGACVGLAVGVVYAAFATAVAALAGPATFQDRNGISLPMAIGAYLAGGALGGAIAGMLVPLARWWAGAMVVGVLAALPLFLVLHAHEYGFLHLSRLDEVYVPAVVIGAPCGIITRWLWRTIDPLGRNDP